MPATHPTCGTVYAIRVPGKFIKIGCSEKLDARLYVHRRSYPTMLVLGVMPGGRRVERALQLRMFEHRVEQEIEARAWSKTWIGPKEHFRDTEAAAALVVDLFDLSRYEGAGSAEIEATVAAGRVVAPPPAGLPAHLRLAAWRQATGLHQSAAGALVGVPQSTWSHWENGVTVPREPHARTIERLSEGHLPARDWPIVPAARAALDQEAA